MNKSTDATPADLVPILFLFSALITLYYGWAASYLWGWFMVPLGAFKLSAIQLAGIILTFETMFPKHQKSGAINGYSVLLFPFAALAVGWIFKTLFMG